MEAGTIRSAPQAAQLETAFLAEQGPGFIPAEMHRDDLTKKREDAVQAVDFHRRKLMEAEAVLVSCDSALATLNEAPQMGPDKPTGRY